MSRPEADIGYLVKKTARDRLVEYKSSLKEYKNSRNELFEGLHKTPFIKESRLESIINVINNFTRMFPDTVRSLKSRSPRRFSGLKKASIKVEVINRKNILDNPKIVKVVKDNKKNMRNLFDKEVFREANCTNILGLRGLSIEQLHLLIRKLGHNPTVFFSDPRKENLRFAIDNQLDNGQHPFQDKINALNLSEKQQKKEMLYWQPVFSGTLKRVPGLNNWHNSRTHGLVYKARDKGEDIFYIAVHVDPKNAILAIPEFFGKHTIEDKSALFYHQTAAGKGENYVGTGLSGLGCAIFIKLLKDAQSRGIINKLNIKGEQHLDTTYSILVDDLIVKKIYENSLSKSHYANKSILYLNQYKVSVI